MVAVELYKKTLAGYEASLSNGDSVTNIKAQQIKMNRIRGGHFSQCIHYLTIIF